MERSCLETLEFRTFGGSCNFMGVGEFLRFGFGDI